MRLIVAVLCLTLSGCAPAFAADIPESLAIRALIGEAIGQSDEELLAHAYALKNRGTLRGVYGLHATHTASPTPEQWQRAGKAWWTALLDNNDPLDGRTEWRSRYDLARKPAPADCVDPLWVGDTCFYRIKR